MSNRRFDRRVYGQAPILRVLSCKSSVRGRSVGVLGKDLHLGLLELPHDRLHPLLRPRPDLAQKRLGTDDEPFFVPGGEIGVRFDGIALLLDLLLERECPEELRNTDEEVSFRQMDAWAYSATGA